MMASLEAELDALQAIYEDELRVGRGAGEVTEVSLPLRPTGDSDEACYVKATLSVSIGPRYPDEPPRLRLHDVRGLDDERTRALEQRLDERIAVLQGEPVIFDLIETVRDVLNENNVPSGDCPVCLHPLRNRAYVRAPCFHVFHAACLRGARAFQDEVVREHEEVRQKLRRRKTAEEEAAERPYCPVCRTPLDQDTLSALDAGDADALADAGSGEQDAQQYELPPAVRAVQAQMAQMRLWQQQAGGLIDIEENQRRLFVSDTVVAVANLTPPPTPAQQQQQQQPKKRHGGRTRKTPEPGQGPHDVDDVVVAGRSKPRRSAGEGHGSNG